MDSRGLRILAALVVATVLAAALVGFALLGDGESEAQPPASAVVAGQDQVIELLDGVPQQGSVLGSEAAPVTLVEYADIQCPHCAHFALDGFPHLVWDYVREGDLRIELRGLHFMGDDSEHALRAALAAGEQDRLWHLLDLLFHAQGEPNSGWVTDDLLRAIAVAVPDLDAERMFAEMTSPAVDARMAEDSRAAEAAAIPGTPYFELGLTGEQLRPLEVQSLSAEAFRPAIDELLGR